MSGIDGLRDVVWGGPVIPDGGTLSEGMTNVSPPIDCNKLLRSDKSAGADI
jgi:hypothetical protein